METPNTVDALYEAWVVKLQRENTALRMVLFFTFAALLVIAVNAASTLRPDPPKEAPK
jgi:hypothetical protein